MIGVDVVAAAVLLVPPRSSWTSLSAWAAAVERVSRGCVPAVGREIGVGGVVVDVDVVVVVDVDATTAEVDVVVVVPVALLLPSLSSSSLL